MPNTSKTFGYLAALLIAVLLAPFLYAGGFVFPVGDDFMAAVRAKHFFDVIGGIDNMFSNWWKWSGRYSHHFSTVFWGAAAGSRVASTFVASLSFLLTWVSIFGIAKELGPSGENGQPVFMATFGLFAVLCSHAAPIQWYALVDIFSLINAYSFSLLYIWSLCRLWNRPVLTRGTKIFCLASGIAAVGFYEYSALLVLMASLAAVFLARLYGHPHRAFFALLAKVALVCFLLMYLARGNFRRQAKRGMDFAAMFGQVLNAGKDWWTYIVPAYCNAIYAAAFFVAVWFVPGWKIPLDKKLPASLILLGGLALICCFSFGLTLVHAMSDVTVGEAGKLPACIVQFSVVIFLFALFACRDRLRLDALRRLGKPLSLLVVLGILLAGNNNFFPVLWGEVLGETGRYAAAYEKRKTIMAAHPGETVAVMPFLYAPPAVYPDTLASGVKSWPNKYAAPFYGLAGLDARMPSAEEAFRTAERQGLLDWKDAGNGTNVSYVPSLPLPPNDTYTFDWIFLSCNTDAEPVVRVVVLPQGSFLLKLPMSGAILERLGNGAWPFRKLFHRPGPASLPDEGGRYYAIPLPQSDSAATGVGDDTFISVDGGAFIPALGNRAFIPAP